MDINTNKLASITTMMTKGVTAGKLEWEQSWVDKDGNFNGIKNAKTDKPYDVTEMLNLLSQGVSDEVVASESEWKSLGYAPAYEAQRFTLIDGTEVIGASEVRNAKGEAFKIPEFTYPGEDYARNQLDEVLDRYFKAEGITYVETEGSKSYYSPSEDKIVLPLRKQFTSAAGFYATKAHEAIHSTGAYVRCFREGFDERRYTEFGSMKYSREELVAEIGACFLLATFGMDTSKTERNAMAYIQHWLKELQSNTRWIRTAAEQAREAVEYILECAEE